MSHILAIEPDSQRQTLLMALIREHTLADVTMVDSVKEAIASFERQQPDLIVAPALLSPEDSERLTSHVKWQADPHVQMLTVPALDMLRKPASEENPGFGFFRRRRSLHLGLQYDPSVLAGQIADRLDRALALRDARVRDVRPLLRGQEGLLAGDAVLGMPLRSTVCHAALRDRAERTAQRDPWLWSVRLPWGTDVQLVNISRTGVLIESGSKVTPGISLDLQLTGMGHRRVVLARFVRSEIARVDRLGVRYHAAAQFEQPLDILTPRQESAPSATPRALADLFTTVVSESNHQEDASIPFARGLRGLVGARDVLIRPTPVSTGPDCESIYFRLSGQDRSGMILQILFDRDRAVTSGEFRLMKAATGLVSALLEFAHASGDTPRPRSVGMAEVA